MQRDDLKPLINYNAKRRAKTAKEFLQDTLKIKDVEVCENYTKDQVVEVFEKLQKEGDEFEKAQTDNAQAIFGVIIVWFGLYMRTSQYKTLYSKLDDAVWPSHFMFDPEGNFIACPQHCLNLARNSKTRVTYFQDDPHLSSKLNDIKYVN